MKLFGVTPLLQNDEITEYCFGKCRKVLIGGIDGGDGIGPLFPCKHEVCEYEDKRTGVVGTIIDIDGEEIEIIVRKLKSAENKNNNS